MTQLASLAWKEWHEVRWFLIVALALFVGMPILGSLEGRLFFHMSRFFFDAAPWVVTLGGVLAVMIAVGIVCSDLGGRLEDFVRSRPLNLTRWILVKYLVGLIATLAACVLPLILELAVNNFSTYHTNVAIVWYPFFWTALYTLAFLAALLVRRTAHAMMLGLAAMLLMYFLPIVLPFLQYMSIDWVLDPSQGHSYFGKSFALPWGGHVQPRQFLFIASMLGISAAALALSILAIRRDWRIESGAKMMYWSVGSSLLILFTSASLRLATNVPIESQIELPRTEFISSMRVEGSRGIVLSTERDRDSGTFARTFEISGSKLVLGPVIRLPNDIRYFNGDQVVWSPSNPDLIYLSNYTAKREYPRPYSLRTISLPSGTDVAPPIHLWDIASINDHSERPRLHIFGDRLYGIGDKLAVLDISEPAKPRLLSLEQVRYRPMKDDEMKSGVWVQLPHVPGLSPRERLQMRGSSANRSTDGETMCMAQGNAMWVYKLDRLDDFTAHFSAAGHTDPTLLEHVFGTSLSNIVAGNGTAYLNQWNSLAGTSYRLSIFDIRDPQVPRLIGHFATPAQYSVRICPLPEGRAIIGADNNLYLVGSPPQRN